VPEDRALVAHLLRRTGFGPLPGRVDELAASGIATAIDTVLAGKPVDPGRTPNLDDEGRDTEAPVRRWLELMARPEAGLHEKMVWFWHGHLTSSYDKVGSWKLMWRQHLLLREHALGNFRTLVQAVTVDPAMLVYLDGADSTAASPNENYGRELMELFTLGRGNYTQEDVRAAARALSGWSVDYDRATVSFDPDTGNQGGVAFLGTQVTHAEDVVDAVCRHPACPGFVCGRLYRYFVGESPPPDRLAELGDLFSSSGLETRPVVDSILRDRVFLERRMNRPRYPVEWVTAAMAALGVADPKVAYDSVSTLAQTPFYPPNVSGWPAGARWLSPSFALARAATAVQSKAVAEVRDAADPVGAALARCSLYEVSDTTANALSQAASSAVSDAGPDERASLVLALALSTPEFALA
jgi:uncharacterized protein (DUF1800 family)